MADGDWRASAGQSAEEDLSPALRVFHRGRMFSYGVTVYNARFDERTRQPAVEMQARLLRDDQVVWQGKRFPVVFQRGFDARRIPAGGVLELGDKSAPGEYLLEVQAFDADGKRTVTMSQWVDFELR